MSPTPDAVSVRPAVVDDLAAVVRLERSGDSDACRRRIGRRRYLLLVCGGDVVGLARLDWIWESVPYLGLIRIEPEFRGRGYSRLLLRAVTDRARDAGQPRLFSSSTAGESAPQAWHRHLGFRDAGMIKQLNDSGEDEVFFHLDIPPPESDTPPEPDRPSHSEPTPSPESDRPLHSETNRPPESDRPSHSETNRPPESDSPSRRLSAPLHRGLSTGDVRGHIMRLAAPAAVGMFFQTLYNITDTFYAGWISTGAQASLAFAFPVFFIMLSCCVGAGQAVTAQAAAAVGGGHLARARYFFGQGIVLSAAVAVFLVGVCVPLAGTMLSALGAKGTELKDAADYSRIVLLGSPFFLMFFIANSALNAVGDTDSYRNCLVGAALLNVVLDPILMFGWFGLPALGVAGVALATVISQGFCAAYLLWIFSRGVLGKRWRAVFLRPRAPILKSLAAQAIPPTANMLCIGAGFFIVTGFLGALDSAAVAAYGIALRLEQLFLLPTIGLSIALLAVAGQNYGAKRPERAMAALRSATRLGWVFVMICGPVILLAAEPLIGFFNDSPEVLAHGRGYLWLAAFVAPFYIVIHMSGALLQAASRPRAIAAVAALRLIVIPPFSFWLLAMVFGLGVSGIWLSIFLVNVAAAVLIWRWRVRVLDRPGFRRTDAGSGTEAVFP